MTVAMREQNSSRLSVLRMLSAAVKNKEIERRSAGKSAMSDDDIVAVIRTEIKRRNDAADGFTKGGRNDLAEKEAEEARILAEYAPAEVDDGAIESVARDIVSALGRPPSPEDFGRVMGEAMKRLKGQASGDRVSGVVREVLSG